MSHPEGRLETRVFYSALGMTIQDAMALKSAIQSAILTNAATQTEHDDYGTRFQ